MCTAFVLELNWQSCLPGTSQGFAFPVTLWDFTALQTQVIAAGLRFSEVQQRVSVITFNDDTVSWRQGSLYKQLLDQVEYMSHQGNYAGYHDAVRRIMHDAGAAILEVYNSAEGVEVITKADDSPLTIADQRAHKIIVAGLQAIDSSIPILSEESELPAYEERRHWQCYWLVDPLDGTKEFINRNGEFTVNIALIVGGHPVAGWVYVPVKEQLYYGWNDVEAVEAFREDSAGVEAIHSRSLNPASKVVVVASRRHGGEALESMLGKAKEIFADIELQSIGSSLKICLVAEGKADWYPRLAPTSEWDTAAAHAVLLGAGGVMVDTQLASLDYNQKESILNPHFHALARTNPIWKELLGS